MRRLLVFLMAALAVAILAAAVACGGDDDGGEEGANGDGSPTATLDAGDDGDDSSGDDSGDDDGSVDGDDSGDDSGDDDGGFTGDINPCELVTQDEVSAALGEEVGAGELSDFDAFVSCDFESESFSTVGVTIYTDTTGDIEEFFELGNEESEEVGGLGDKAYWNDTFNDLEILVGDRDLSISVFGSGETDNRAVAIELAEKALERLP